MNKSTPRYVPMLKGKKNDLQALRELSDSARALISPLVDMPPKPVDVAIEGHTSKFVSQLKAYYPLGSLTVDTYAIAPASVAADGTPSVIYVLRELQQQGRIFTPCYGLHRNDDLWSGLGEIAQELDCGFCFRIDFDDMDDAAEDTWIEISQRIVEMNLKASVVDLILDLRDMSTKPNSIESVVLDFLQKKPLGVDFRSITVVGSSALKMVAAVPKDGESRIPRRELNLWLNLRKKLGVGSSLGYGDYGVIHPEFSGLTKTKNANGKIRYTSGDSIIYVRGHGLTNPVSDYAQYHELSRRVIALPEFMNSAFSYGDQRINMCALRLTSTGNLGTWVCVDMNHHMELTSRQFIAILLNDLSRVPVRQELAVLA